ncbi:hypothetical protein H8E52_00355 [bacterium]|nr:hypothetical protein [bacterium]
MESYARNFVKVSVVSIVIGMLLGLGMASSEVMLRYLPVHTHLLLVGFMANMIFGVGYHIIPRFQGHAIIPWAWATLHFYLSLVGLILMLTGWSLRLNGMGMLWVLPLGGGLEFVGVLIFLVIMWRGLSPLKVAK